MANKSYADKLKDPRWQKKRLEILQRDEFRCTLCNDPSTTLHVHHKSYHGDPWETPEEELTSLCEHCHLLAENIKSTGWKPIRVSKAESQEDNCIIILAMLVDCGSKGNGVCLYHLNSLSRKLTELINLGAQMFWTLTHVLNTPSSKKPKERECQPEC